MSGVIAAAERASLAGHLRHLVAVMERERQALATLDADALFLIVREKEELCEALGHFGSEALDHPADIGPVGKVQVAHDGGVSGRVAVPFDVARDIGKHLPPAKP